MQCVGDSEHKSKIQPLNNLNKLNIGGLSAGNPTHLGNPDVNEREMKTDKREKPLRLTQVVGKLRGVKDQWNWRVFKSTTKKFRRDGW